MHKVVTVKPKNHYYDTTVPFDKSMNDIIKLLRKHNCSKIAPLEEAGNPPLTTLFFEKDHLPYIIEFPVTYVERHESNQHSPLIKKLRMEISGRVIHDRVKALLIEVEYGFMDFEEIMMPLLLVKPPQGRSQPLSEYLITNKDKLATGDLFDTVQRLLQ